MSDHIHIYRATRGRYTKPVPLPEAGIKWVNDNDKEIKPPLKYPCAHPKHWEWGNGTRNGQKLWYPIEDMFHQVWHLTKKEMKEAIDNWDMASLEFPSRIICKNCASKT